LHADPIAASAKTALHHSNNDSKDHDRHANLCPEGINNLVSEKAILIFTFNCYSSLLRLLDIIRSFFKLETGRRGNAVFHTKLRVNSLQMFVYGGRSYNENCADLSIRLTVGKPEKHFTFTWGMLSMAT
jgi:hypothetical protein